MAKSEQRSESAGPNRTADANNAVSNKSERVVTLGRINGAFGVAGWVKVESFTDPPGNLLKYPVWLVRVGRSGEWKSTRRVQGREVSKALHVQFEGVTDRDVAQTFRNAEIGVRRSELPAPPQGEYYWDDLIGLEAFDVEGARLGRVVELMSTPAHPLLRVVDVDAKAEECLVPLVRERLKAVDLNRGRVTLDWRRDWLRDE